MCLCGRGGGCLAVVSLAPVWSLVIQASGQFCELPQILFCSVSQWFLTRAVSVSSTAGWHQIAKLAA